MGHGHWRVSKKKSIFSKWVSKLKVGANGKHVKHETILMARGFRKVKGFEYEDIFVHMIKWGILISLVALVAQLIQMENFTPKCINKISKW
jgi:hypothetical protein